MINDKVKPSATKPNTALPRTACLPINRCNLPARILGSLTFQYHPVPLEIDGVGALHAELFSHLDAIDSVPRRARLFADYMAAHFQLAALDEAGYEENMRLDRRRADYIHALRGWHFDSDGREGAILKAWVESRFGLVPRHHRGPIRDANGDTYRAYLQAYAEGVYNTNALEAQLDLVYHYCQYELVRDMPEQTHERVYRGLNDLESYETLQRDGARRIVVLNNLNSFSSSRERAGEFGDYVIEARVPRSKIFYRSALLPIGMRGENEVMVIGGVYEIGVCTHY